MTVAAFFGYLFLSCGPPLAAGLPFFYHRSMLSLTTITSMFAWLAILIFTSGLFRAFVPLDSSAVGYVPLLITTVLIEEGARIGFWYMQKAAGKKLKQLAITASVRFSLLDEVSLSYAIGWGHGFTHLLFQFGPFLPITWYTATAYSSQCPNMSIFMVSCLTQLGMFAILAGGHVVFISSLSAGRFVYSALPGAVHLIAALATLLNFARDGCYTSVPAVLALGVFMAAAAATVVWTVPRHATRAAAAAAGGAVGTNGDSGRAAFWQNLQGPPSPPAQ